MLEEEKEGKDASCTSETQAMLLKAYYALQDTIIVTMSFLFLYFPQTLQSMPSLRAWTSSDRREKTSPFTYNIHA